MTRPAVYLPPARVVSLPALLAEAATIAAAFFALAFALVILAALVAPTAGV